MPLTYLPTWLTDLATTSLQDRRASLDPMCASIRSVTRNAIKFWNNEIRFHLASLSIFTMKAILTPTFDFFLTYPAMMYIFFLYFVPMPEILLIHLLYYIIGRRSYFSFIVEINDDSIILHPSALLIYLRNAKLCTSVHLKIGESNYLYRRRYVDT